MNKEEAVQVKKQYFHQACLEEKEQQIADRKELIQYICELYKLEAPTGLILKQIKDFQEQYSYKLKGMTLALQYFHETLGNPAREGDGIGIIPFVYEDAKKHYIMKMNVENSLENIKSYNEKKTIKINSPQLNFKRKVQPIDFNLL